MNFSENTLLLKIGAVFIHSGSQKFMRRKGTSLTALLCLHVQEGFAWSSTLVAFQWKILSQEVFFFGYMMFIENGKVGSYRPMNTVVTSDGIQIYHIRYSFEYHKYSYSFELTF